MPPKKAVSAVKVEELEYQNPATRNSDFEVFLRPGANKVVSIAPIYALGPRHRIGYKRLMIDDIELMDGDQTVPFEKDFGMYWCESDHEGFAVIRPQGGEDHYVLAMDLDVRNRRMAQERARLEMTNDNVSDQQLAAQASRALKRGSEYEADDSQHVEAVQY